MIGNPEQGRDRFVLQSPYHPLSILDGREIIDWVGCEMALCGGEQSTWTDAGGIEHMQLSPVQWEHRSVPYLQLISVDIRLADGAAFRLLSQLEDGTGFHGLFLVEQKAASTWSAASLPQEDGIFRARRLEELPLGVARVVAVRRDQWNAVVEASIIIADATIRIVAAEVHPTDSGEFAVVEPDESILLQLNGTRPSADPRS